MTEMEYWKIVNNLQSKNRPKLLVQGVIIPHNQKELKEANRIYSNCLNSIKLDEFPKNKLGEVSELLFKKNVSTKAKEMIIMDLAHEGSKEALKTLKKYTKAPDNKLKYFSKLALQECTWWNT